MPEPLLYLQAMALAAGVSAAILLLPARWVNARRLTARWPHGRCALAIAAGLAAGYYRLSLPIGWPPVNGLARWLLIVLPLVLLIESLGGLPGLPRWCLWALRAVLAVAVPRILLHGSVYLSGPDYGWSSGRAMLTMLLCSGALVVFWTLLTRLACRAAAASVLGSLVLAILVTGLAVMLAGYIGGGAAALPLAACLIAVASAQPWLGPAPSTGKSIATDGSPATDRPTGRTRPNPDEWLRRGGSVMLGVGVMGLFGLLFVGHFFGRLSLPSTAVIGLSPLLGWVTELPWTKLLQRQRPLQRQCLVASHRPAWLRGSLRIALVAIPLAVLLVLAKQQFDRELAPLM